MYATSTNLVIQSRYFRILRYTSQSGIFPGYQKSINTTSKWVSESIIWSIWCASLENKFINLQCDQAIMNWYIFLLPVFHQNPASILNKILCSWLFSSSGDTLHSGITKCMNLTGTTLRPSLLTLDVHGLSQYNINPFSRSRHPFWNGLEYPFFIKYFRSVGVLSGPD